MPVQKEVHQLGPYAYKTRKIKTFGFNTDKSDKKRAFKNAGSL